MSIRPTTFFSLSKQSKSNTLNESSCTETPSDSLDMSNLEKGIALDDFEENMDNGQLGFFGASNVDSSALDQDAFSHETDACAYCLRGRFYSASLGTSY